MSLPFQQITHHQGNCVVFNLCSVLRLKGKSIKTAAERWKEDEEHPLIVRLKSDDSIAWMTGHRGYEEIFRSRIFMRAATNLVRPETVHVIMRQWTKRKDDPITRQFSLSFGCSEFAEAFVFTHNCLLTQMEKMKETKCFAKLGWEEEVVEDNACGGGGDEVESSSNYGESNQELEDDESEDELCWIEDDMPNTQDPFADYISD